MKKKTIKETVKNRNICLISPYTFTGKMDIGSKENGWKPITSSGDHILLLQCEGGKQDWKEGYWKQLEEMIRHNTIDVIVMYLNNSSKWILKELVDHELNPVKIHIVMCDCNIKNKKTIFEFCKFISITPIIESECQGIEIMKNFYQKPETIPR